MKQHSTLALVILLTVFCAVTQHESAQIVAPPSDRNVMLVMTDGLRWQEVFRGADASLLTPPNFYHGRTVQALRAKYLAPTAEERRIRLMPFLWKSFIPNGQIFGNLDAMSDAYVTNKFNFSYPGYSETLTGHADPRIHSNDNTPNPNLTVLEWINRQPGYQGRVAAFGAWEVIAGIVNARRCGFTVNVSYDPLLLPQSTAEIDRLNRLKADSPHVWEDEAFDAPVFYTALTYLKQQKPRVLFLSLGETDDWAHEGNYGEYLEAANRFDGDLAQLWNTLQSMPEYRGKTTVILLTDHGRGSGPETWKDHGEKIKESKNIFIGLLGADVPATGVARSVPPVTQNQVAATLAQYLGLDWLSHERQAGKPLRSGTDKSGAME